MADYQIGDKEFAKYEAWLQKEDKAMGTRLKYQRDVRSLQKWLRGRAVNQELLNGWRAALLAEGYIAPRVIVNHGGTVLVKEPIDFGGADRIDLTEDTSPNFLGGTMRVHDFMAASLDELQQYSEEPQLGAM